MYKAGEGINNYLILQPDSWYLHGDEILSNMFSASRLRVLFNLTLQTGQFWTLKSGKMVKNLDPNRKQRLIIAFDKNQTSEFLFKKWTWHDNVGRWDVRCCTDRPENFRERSSRPGTPVNCRFHHERCGRNVPNRPTTFSYLKYFHRNYLLIYFICFV